MFSETVNALLNFSPQF